MYHTLINSSLSLSLSPNLMLISFPLHPPTTYCIITHIAIDAVIGHPDEMECLEQYRVLDDYHRKDSHQVNLHAGQIVHVIEKHDTGVCVCVCVCVCARARVCLCILCELVQMVQYTRYQHVS